MQYELKEQIIKAALAYMQEKELNNNDVARGAKINQGYLSNMLRFNFTNVVNDKPVDIADKWFHQLADYVGFKTTKEYWSTLPTRQSKEIIMTLEDAKENGKTAMILGETGIGKTKSIDVFVNKNPHHTYRVTVSSLYKLIDIISELADKLGVENPALYGVRAYQYSIKIRVDRIVNKLIEIKRSGGKPIIIFDEAENLEFAVLKMIKGLYDQINDHSGIVLIGTQDLMNKLLNLKKKNRYAIPQLYRRFKAGLKTLPLHVKELDFKAFFERYNCNKDVQALLMKAADNYGELHDFLNPALREADVTNQPLTVELLKRIHPELKKFQS